MSNSNNQETVTIPMQYLKRVKEHLADLHGFNTEHEPDNHLAIAYCECSVANDYRITKELLR